MFSGDPESADEQRLGIGKPVLMDLGSVSVARKSITTKKDALLLEEEAASKVQL